MAVWTKAWTGFGAFSLVILLVTIPLQCQTQEFDDDDLEEPMFETADELAPLDNNVLVLNKEIFDEVIESKDTILVEFYAPWCGHCKQLAPQYEAAAERLRDVDPPIALAKIDATIEVDLAKRFDVNGYPTLKWFKRGVVHDYDGPRDEDGIVAYMVERSHPDWLPPPDAAITLTKENFRDIVDMEELMLVEFFAPWCGHCKKLAPEFEKAAKELAKKEPPIKLGKVDATVETALANEFDVTGYPTLKIFRWGKVFDYKGGRDKWGIVQYMEKQRGMASKQQDTLKEVKEFMRKDDCTVVAFFEDETDERYTTYQDAVNDLREDYDLAHTFAEEARKHYKVNPGSLVVFHPERFHTKHEPKYHIFEKAEPTKADIAEFITTHHTPLVGHYQISTADKRYKKTRPLLVMFMTVDFSFDHVKNTQMWRNKLANIAVDHKDITFTIANEEDFKEVFSVMGFDDNGEEINIGIINENERKFAMEPMEEWDSDHIRDFIESYKAGKLKPMLKSQAVPKKQKGPVKVVVGRNFEDIVLDSTKDVLIEFYAPWCGHCKQLEPVYKDLARKYKKDKDLVIAKFDATANDAPTPYEAEGFPTIFFATRGKKADPVKFTGNSRTLEDLSQFVEDHSTVPLMPDRDEL